MSDDEEKPGVTVNLPFSGKVLQTLPVEDRRAMFKPFVALGTGLGKLIERKFEVWNEDERNEQLALMESAVSRAGDTEKEPNRKNVSRILDASVNESDANIRELWTNLLANEFQSGTHPDFVSILDRMNHEDAFRLLKIAERQGFVPGEEQVKQPLDSLKDLPVKFAEALNVLLNLPWQKLLVEGLLNAARNQPTARERFIDEHLVDLQLVRYEENSSAPRLTYTGKEFLKSVSDPSLVIAAKNSSDSAVTEGDATDDAGDSPEEPEPPGELVSEATPESD